MSGAAMTPSPVRRLATAWYCLALAALGVSIVAAAILAVSDLAVFANAGLSRPAFLLHAVLAALWPLAMAAAIFTLSETRAGIVTWGSWWLALAGMSALLVSPGLGGKFMANPYLPMLDNPLFLGGAATFGLALGGIVLRAMSRLQRLDPAAGWFVAVLVAVLGLLAAGLSRAGSSAGLGALVPAVGQALQLAYTLLLLGAWSALAKELPLQRCALHGICALALLPVLGCVVLSGFYPSAGPEYQKALAWLMRWASWPAPVLLASVLVRQLIGKVRQGPLTAEQKGLVLSLSLYVIGAAAAVYGAPVAQLHGSIGALIVACLLWWRRAMPGFMSSGKPAGKTRRDVRPWAIAITLLLVLGGGWLLQSIPRPNGAFSPREHAAAQIKADIDARFQQGVVMLHAKQYEHALTAFHRVLELAPEMPEAHVNMGFALIGLKRYEEAGDFFESATQLRPNQINAYYGMAVAQEGMGNLRGALEAMEAYVHLAKADDPFLPKANAAIWEWRSALDSGRGGRSPG